MRPEQPNGQNGSGGHSNGGPPPTPTTPAAEPAARPLAQPIDGAKPTFGGRLSKFLDRIKPYREILAVIVALSAAISGGISWAITYFATRADIAQLECKLLDQIEAKVGPVRTGVGMAQARWRRAQADHLLDQQSAENRNLIKSLLKEADELQAEQEKRDIDALKEFRAIVARCMIGSPKPASSP
jgi:hypothetical protein